MRAFDSEIRNNNFRERKDLFKYMDDLFAPIEGSFIRHNTRIHFSNTSSGAADSVSGIEGFSRLLWGLSVHDGRGPEDRLWQKIRQGLCHGTDPMDQDYFGKPVDFDQRIVEMAAIGYAFVLKPECIYEPLSDLEKANLYKWLDRINHVEAYECNWKFFRVMVNIGFKHLGLPYNEAKMKAYLEDIDQYYVGKGWYTDGKPQGAHVDYYVAFAMQFYGIFYSMFMKDVDPERCKVYEERAVEFADEFIHWFGVDGSALPYGRSLTYKYAQSAFWSILAASGIETSVSLGQIKGLILRNMRWWNDKPIYDIAGFLTVGYTYPNMFMAEDYNAPGSLYWSLKTMAVAMLPEDHPFWTVEEEPLPVLQASKIIEPARLVIRRQEGSDQIIAYNGGNFHTNGHIHVETKYEKFAYSNVFAFSAPRSHRTLAFGAFDSTLAISKDGSYYRHKEKSGLVNVSESLIHTKWQPYEDVTIDTYLIPDFPWHIRLHRIRTPHCLQVAEGGFAMALGEEGDQQLERVKGASYDNGISIGQGYYSGIVDLTGNQSFEPIIPASNTNIMASRTVIPSLRSSHEPGLHWIGSLVFGDKHAYELPEIPRVVIEEKVIHIVFEESERLIKVALDDSYNFDR